MMSTPPVEYGPPPVSFPEDQQQYEAGYAFGWRKRLLMTGIELNKYLEAPCNDSFTEGFQDALSGKERKYGR